MGNHRAEQRAGTRPCRPRDTRVRRARTPQGAPQAREHAAAAAARLIPTVAGARRARGRRPRGAVTAGAGQASAHERLGQHHARPQGPHVAPSRHARHRPQPRRPAARGQPRLASARPCSDAADAGARRAPPRSRPGAQRRARRRWRKPPRSRPARSPRTSGSCPSSRLPPDRPLRRVQRPLVDYHTGLDFAAPTGTPIIAVANGTITETGYAGAYGNRTVETLDDGTELWYCHQTAFGVQRRRSRSAPAR